jgi:type II secretory pathway component GspD/PulD (secretin)
MALQRAAGLAGILAAAALPPVAHAQAPVRVFLSTSTVTISNGIPVVTRTLVATGAGVPDGGTVTLGGSSRLAEARTEAGAPVLGKLPYADRGFRNAGYGRSVGSTRVTASVRVIDLREEEYRQTGYRSP